MKMPRLERFAYAYFTVAALALAVGMICKIALLKGVGALLISLAMVAGAVLLLIAIPLQWRNRKR